MAAPPVLVLADPCPHNRQSRFAPGLVHRSGVRRRYDCNWGRGGLPAVWTRTYGYLMLVKQQQGIRTFTDRLMETAWPRR